MREQYQVKFEEQSALLESLKSELTKAVQKNKEQHEKLMAQHSELSDVTHNSKILQDDKQRLEMEVQSTNRQLMMVRS